MAFIDLFTNPIYRAPLLSSILLCFCCAIMGTILFFQKRLLISETLSHAAYPGAILSIIALSFFGENWDFLAPYFIFCGAALTAWLAKKFVFILENEFNVSSDSALCFTLSSFFGFGVLLISILQQIHPFWLNQVHPLLFGQIATVTDAHLFFYVFLSFVVALIIFLNFQTIHANLFDPIFAKSLKLKGSTTNSLLWGVFLLTLVVGIRSVGVLLLSGMLVFPPVASRVWAIQFSSMLWIATFIGILSGLLGNLLSINYGIATGPCIIVFGGVITLFSLLFAPKRGFIPMIVRTCSFQNKKKEENLLKLLWKRDLDEGVCSRFLVLRLKRQGWIKKENGKISLTEEGKIRAASMVRLHRLWELYLTQHLNFSAEQVHANAEEMEHRISKDLEEQLTNLLLDPSQDPHSQPIPRKDLK